MVKARRRGLRTLKLVVVVLVALSGLLALPIELKQLGLLPGIAFLPSSVPTTVTVTSVQYSDSVQLPVTIGLSASVSVSVNCGYGIVVNSTGPIDCPALVAQKLG